MREISVVGALILSGLFANAQVNTIQELEAKTNRPALVSENTKEISALICNGTEQFVDLGFNTSKIISVSPKIDFVAEKNGIWISSTKSEILEFSYRTEEGVNERLKLNIDVEFVSAKFSVSPNEGTKPLEIQTKNESSNAVSYSWDFGSGTSNEINPSISYYEAGEYQISLSVKGEKGCTDVSTKKNISVYEEGEFFIPNAFTPNFDGRNETFFVIPKNILEFTCEVYNQYGELITTLNSKEDVWDGNFNGYPAPSGNYIYRIQYSNLANESKKLVGSVELRR